MAAARTLPHRLAAVDEPGMGIVATARAEKALWPSGRLQRLRTGRLGAVAAQEPRQRQTGLELDAVHGHRSSSKGRELQRWQGRSHTMRLVDSWY